MQTSWQTAAVGQHSLTAALAGFTAAHFLRQQGREARPGARNAALALGLSAAGTALAATYSIALAAGGEPSAGGSVAVGLPALAGQALTALLVLRRLR